MAPTLIDGQWALVLRGAGKVRIGDIALFISPDYKQLAVKRCVLSGDENPQVKHGWLMTDWGECFLTGKEWRSLVNSPKPPADSFFMIGDNQFNSLDSREYGYIDRDKLLGRVLIWRRRG